MKTLMASLLIFGLLLTKTACALPENSIYQINGQWTNDYGVAVTLAAQKGRFQVVTMFFSHCQYACPLLVEKMKRLEAALPANLRGDVVFTLVSLDAELDTPAALHNYREQHKLGPKWTLLHGSADEILDLAAVLDVKFRKAGIGQFQHSNLITVLNKDGEIACQESGLSLDTAELVRQIEASSRNPGSKR